MKRIGLALLFSSILSIVPGMVPAASAATTSQLSQCVFGLCFAAVDLDDGTRILVADVNSGNGTNTCASVFIWVQGTPIRIWNSAGALAPHAGALSDIVRYDASIDATINVFDCTTNGKIMTLLIGAGDAPNRLL